MKMEKKEEPPARKARRKTTSAAMRALVNISGLNPGGNYGRDKLGGLGARLAMVKDLPLPSPDDTMRLMLAEALDLTNKGDVRLAAIELMAKCHKLLVEEKSSTHLHVVVSDEELDRMLIEAAERRKLLDSQNADIITVSPEVTSLEPENKN